MKDKDTQQALIDQYLLGNLDGKALQELEQRIQGDPAFAEEVAFQLAMRRAVRKEKIAAFEKINRERGEKKRWWLFLIPLLIILGIFLYDNWNITDPIPDSSIQNPKPPDNPSTSPSEIDTTPVGSPPSEANNPPSNDTPANPPPKDLPEEIAVILTEREKEDALKALRQKESNFLRDAGSDQWKADLDTGRDSMALAKLENIINDPEDFPFKVHYYFAGVLHLYTENGDLKKALDYLTKAKGFPRTDLPLHQIGCLC